MLLLLLLVSCCCPTVLAQGLPALAPSTIVVVDARTGLPCRDAQVWVVGADHPSYQSPREVVPPTPERLARDGKAFRSDARGEVALPAALQASGIVEVGASAGGRWAASARPWPPQSRWVLAVEDDPVVMVHLRGPDDRPLALGLYSSVQQEPHTPASTMRQQADAMSGTVLVRPMALRQLGAAAVRHPGHLDDEGLLQIALDAVTSTPIRAWLDLQRPLPPDVTLRAPALGALLVCVTDGDGQPLDPGHANAAAIDPATGQRVLHGVHQPIRGGEVRFPAVALGLQVQVQISDEFGMPMVVTLAGPTTAGEQILHAVTLPKHRPDGRVPHTVSGRLLDAAGEPIPRRIVHLSADANVSGNVAVRGSGTTDAAGRFVVSLLGPFVAGTELVLAGAASGRVDHFAVRPLQHTRRGSELGDVRLASAPLLVAGRVLDTRGRPVEAQLDVRRQGHPDTDAPALPGTHGIADRTGTFALHAPFVTTKPLRVRCRPMLGGGEFEQVVAPASRDVVFTVPALTAVAGGVRLADARQSRHLQVLLLEPTTDDLAWCGRPTASAPASVAADGSFVTWPVAAGTYHLVIRLANAFELARVTNVQVPADGEVADPRLQAIDLTAALREVTVTTDSGGRAPGSFDVLCFEPAPGSMSLPQLVHPSVAVALRERPQQVWLPTGPFTVQVRRNDAVSPADAELSPKVEIRDGKASPLRN